MKTTSHSVNRELQAKLEKQPAKDKPNLTDRAIFVIVFTWFLGITVIALLSHTHAEL